MGAITVDADENWRDSEASRGSAVVLADGLKWRKRDGEDSLIVLQENGRRARSIENIRASGSPDDYNINMHTRIRNCYAVNRKCESSE